MEFKIFYTNKKNIFLVFIVIFIVIFLSGCVLSTQSEKETSNIVEKIPYSKDIADIFPSDLVVWEYNGFLDYMHKMWILSIMDSTDEKIYKISGEVEDLSDGESGSDYNFSITYTIKGDSVYQNQSGIMLFDTDYKDLILIKEPLEAGNTWDQVIENENGNKININSSIIKVEKGDSNIYHVEYYISEEGRYERRIFEEGKGITYYEAEMIGPEDTEKYIIHYSMTNIKEVDLTKNTDGDEKGYTLRTPSDKELEEANALSVNVNNDNGDKDNLRKVTDEEEHKIENLIMDFNSAWVNFANQGDQQVRDYLVAGEAADKIVDRYKVKDTNLRFKTMKLKKIDIIDDVVYAYVYEEILKDVDGDTILLPYDWVYKIVIDKDNEYKIVEYISNLR